MEGLENLTEKEEEKKEKKSDSLQRFTDKMFCPNCNIVYPEFTTKHFSPNRQEGACEHCNGIGEILQVDYNKIIDPNSSFRNAILPWRDSNLGQEVLRKLAEKYSMDLEKPRKDQPERFLHAVVYGDNENMRVMIAGKMTTMVYRGIEEIIKDQYAKGVLTVDFQAMLDMKPCPHCFGSKLKKESLYVFLTFPQKAKKELEKLPHFKDFFVNKEDLAEVQPLEEEKIKINIWDMQKIPLQEVQEIIQIFISFSSHEKSLIEKITKPLLDRMQTVIEL